MIKKVALLIILMLMPAFTFAAEFQTGEGQSTTVGSNEKVRNLYIAGANIDINSNVSKDLIGAGAAITINGNIEDDLWVAGGTISLNGNVGGSARVAGSSIMVLKNITEDLFAAGNTIIIKESSNIAGDFVGAGSKTELLGTINGNVKYAGEELVLGGSINGDVMARNVKKLIVRDNTKINGKLTYYSPTETTIPSGAKILGGTNYNKTNNRSNSILGTVKAETAVYGLLTSFIFLLLFVYIFPLLSRKYVEGSYSVFLTNLGWGLFTLIIVPVALLLMLFSVVLTKIALLLGLVYIVYLMVAAFLTPLLLGSGLLKSLNKESEFRLDWKTAIFGAVVLALLNLIPMIGQLTLFIFFLVSLGYLAILTYRFKNR